MALAPLGYVLWTQPPAHNPADPTWPDRDRFVLSAGHASMLLYSAAPPHRLRPRRSTTSSSFRQWESRTPGHPEYGHTPGVETTTGPLGQGVGNAVGMAVAEAHLAATFNRDGHAIVDHHTYFICSDGDLMEGVSHEAASFAGHFEARQADRLLRRQPHHDRRQHRPHLQRRRAQALRGVRLARAARRRRATTSTRSTRAIAAGEGRDAAARR